MMPARRTPLTLLAALLLGAALGLLATGGKPPPPSAHPAAADRDDPAARGTPPPASRAGRESSSALSSAASTSAAYAAAWELLLDRELSGEERHAIARALLEEWSQIDLRAALHAAFSQEMPSADDPFAPSALGSCFKGIEGNLDLAWELIESREYGLHTRRLRWKWIDTVAETRAPELVRRLPDLPADCRVAAIREAITATHRPNDPAPGKDEVFDAVLALRGTPDEAAAMEGLAIGLSSAVLYRTLRDSLLQPPEPGLRDLYFHAYVRSLDQLSADERPAELDSLPADLRAEVEASPHFPGRSSLGLPLPPEE